MNRIQQSSRLATQSWSVGLVVLGALASAGCAKSSTETRGPAAFAQAVLDGWQERGLTISELRSEESSSYGAQQCARGSVAGIDVLLCRYASPAAAKRSQPRLTTFVRGALTGAVRQKAELLVAAADRARIDLAGKTMQKLLASLPAS